MSDLTKRQKELFDFIDEYLGERGMPPTIAEIAAALGVASTHGIRGHLQALQRKGVVELVPGASRGIRLIEGGAGRRGLPVVGRVAAGRPVLAAEHIEDTRPLAPALFRPRADYLLRVQGMSMRDAGILDGDLLAVHRQPAAEEGQIVVARIGDEVTVKRFRRRGHLVRLEAENPEFEALEIDLRREPLDIEGVAVGVVRWL